MTEQVDKTTQQVDNWHDKSARQHNNIRQDDTTGRQMTWQISKATEQLDKKTQQVDKWHDKSARQQNN